MKRSAVLALVILIVTALTGCPWNPEENGYVLVWADEFDGTALDPEWETHPPSQPAPDPDELVVSAGTLKLRSTDPEHWSAITTLGPRQPSEPNYPSPISFEEGYFEARLRYTDDGYSFPAFWLLSSAAGEAFGDPDAHCPTLVSELDVMEGLVPTGVTGRPQRVTHTLHRNTRLLAQDPDGSCGQPDEVNDPPILTEALAGVSLHDWHVWAARWTADEVCWYLDREEVGCAPTFDSTAQPMHLLLSTGWYITDEEPCRAWLYGTNCPPLPEFTEIEVDYVRAWQTP
jgi:hypothetical protein